MEEIKVDRFKDRKILKLTEECGIDVLLKKARGLHEATEASTAKETSSSTDETSSLPSTTNAMTESQLLHRTEHGQEEQSEVTSPEM